MPRPPLIQTAISLALLTVLCDVGEAQPQSGCRTKACLAATVWHRDFCAVLVDSSDPAAGRKISEFVQTAGGRVAVTVGNIVLGWIPPHLDRSLVGRHEIAAIKRTAFDPRSFSSAHNIFASRQNQMAIGFFDAVTSGSLSAQVELGLASHGEPLVGDVGLTNSHMIASASRLLPSTQAADVLPSTKTPHSTNTKPYHPQTAIENFAPPWTNEQMTGRVKVNVFILESDGSIDPDAYTWTWDDTNNAVHQALAGLSFWSYEAGVYGRSVIFDVSAWGPWDLPCNQGYEAILHHASPKNADPYNEDYLWINEVMRKFEPPYLGGKPGGYGANPVTYDTVFSNVEQFNHDQQHLSGYPADDWGFSVFIAYNPPNIGAPTTFANGVFAYTSTFGGPWVQMLFNNGGWGANSINPIMIHETGHEFWACDEYISTCSTCSNCRNFGPRLEAMNRNCYIPTTGGGRGPESTSCPYDHVCIMRLPGQFDLCDDTPTQIGWRE